MASEMETIVKIDGKSKYIFQDSLENKKSVMKMNTDFLPKFIRMKEFKKNKTYKYSKPSCLHMVSY